MTSLGTIRDLILGSQKVTLKVLVINPTYRPIGFMGLWVGGIGGSKTTGHLTRWDETGAF